jgi:hypothetical protein
MFGKLLIYQYFLHTPQFVFVPFTPVTGVQIPLGTPIKIKKLTSTLPWLTLFKASTR